MSGFCFQNESPDHLNNNLIYLLKWKRNVISYHNYHMKKTENFLKVDSLLVSESSYFFCNGKCQLGVAALGFFFFRWCTLTQNLGSNTKRLLFRWKTDLVVTFLIFSANCIMKIQHLHLKHNKFFVPQWWQQHSRPPPLTANHIL